MVSIDSFIQSFDEGNSIDVFFSSMLVWNPLAILSPVIQIKHGGHRIGPQSIDMVLIEPEEGTADQKFSHFRPTVVKNMALPVRLKSFFRVCMLIKESAIKIDQPMFIVWKVRGHPIENNAYSILMKPINQIHEVLRSAISRRGCKVSHRLVSPGAIERMFHYRQEFNVCKSHFLDIIYKIGSHFPIGEEPIFFLRDT